MKVRCECGKELQVPDELIGKKVRCPACQAVLTSNPPSAGSPPPVPPPLPPRREEVEEAEDSYQFQPAPEKPAPEKPSRSSSARSSSASKPRKCHEIDYSIFGGDMQLVEVELDPDETVIAEAGAMCYMEDGISFEAKLGDGSEPNQGFFKRLWGAGKRMLTGESMFMTHFTNTGRGKKTVAFGAPYPGKIVPLDMGELDGEIICQKDAFLCAAHGTKIDIAFQKKLGAGFFGGEGFILQRLKGDGMAFIHACGAIIKKDLGNETLKVDTGCFVAMTPDVEYDIQRAGNLKSMFFGGEGLFLATLTGPGTVWLQSLPFSRLADRISSASTTLGGRSSEEGSILGGLGRLIGGD